jgi:hypothetical protein
MVIRNIMFLFNKNTKITIQIYNKKVIPADIAINRRITRNVAIYSQQRLEHVQNFFASEAYLEIGGTSCK